MSDSSCVTQTVAKQTVLDYMREKHGGADFSSIAEVWFLGTDMDIHSRFIARHAKDILGHFLQINPILFNVVGSWNKRNIRWLRSLGFMVEKTAHRLGPERALFHSFYITKEMFEAKYEK